MCGCEGSTCVYVCSERAQLGKDGKAGETVVIVANIYFDVDFLFFFPQVAPMYNCILWERRR